MDIKKMLNKRFGNAKGYEDGVIYTEVLDNVVYKTYQNGVIRYKKRMGDGFTTTETEVRNNLEWLIPKIPFKYYLMTLDFYKDVYDRYKTEASVLFYWNKDDKEIPQDLLDAYGSGIIQDGKLIIIAPKQSNSTGLSQFVEKVIENGETKKVLTPMVQWLESNSVCIMETHSHNHMSAFWSSTDDANEKHNKLRLFSVIGKVNTEEQVKSRVCLLGDYFDLKMEDVFEMPKLKQEYKLTVMEDGVEKDITGKVAELLDTPEVAYTGPFPYSETHPESWFELFTAVTSTPKPTMLGKGGYSKVQPNNPFKSPHLQYLDEDETALDLDIDDSFDVEDDEEPFDHEIDYGRYRTADSRRNRSGNKLMSLTDDEFKDLMRNNLN